MIKQRSFFCLLFYILINLNLGVCAFAVYDCSSLSQEQARAILPKILDAANIPHGDIAVPSDNVHSGRYIISQWQRLAAGATVIVLSKDGAGNFYVALGVKGKRLVPSEGYMESWLPKTDLTGMRKKGASRINKTSQSLVPGDEDITDCAVREVHEELGLKVNKSQLKLLDVGIGDREENVAETMVVQYGVFLSDSLPPLKTLDFEFGSNDATRPEWYRVTDIVESSDGYIMKGTRYTLSLATVDAIHKAVQTFS